MKATAYSSREEDVGIPSCESYIELGFDLDDVDHRKSVREVLERTFNELHDCGRTIVTFEDEEIDLSGGQDGEISKKDTS